MSQWVKSLVGYLLMVSIVMQMLPDKKYEQYVRLFTGFLLMILVLQPVLKIGTASEYLENKIMEFVQEQETLERKIVQETGTFREKSVQLQTEECRQIEIAPIEQVEVILNENET